MVASDRREWTERSSAVPLSRRGGELGLRREALFLEWYGICTSDCEQHFQVRSRAQWRGAMAAMPSRSSRMAAGEEHVDLAERTLCLRLLACELESDCLSSFAGCFVAPGGGDGVCRSQMEEALATRDLNDLVGHLTDVELPGAQANILGRCLMANECVSCFPPANQCPIIEAFAAVPNTAGIGEPISLSVHATDPDNGPHALSYRWSAAHVDAGFTGVVSDPTAAEPTFTCEIVGETEVVLLVSDGECTAVEYVPITCVE